MGLLDLAKKLKDDIARAADRVIPGDQSSWYAKPAPPPTQSQRQGAAQVGASFGYGPSNPQLPTSAPMSAPTPAPTAPMVIKTAPPPAAPPKPGAVQSTINSTFKVGLDPSKAFSESILRALAPSAAPKAPDPTTDPAQFVTDQAAKGAVGVVHGFADIAPRIAVEGADMLDPSKTHTFQADNPINKIIFGSEPIRSYQDQNEEFQNYLVGKGLGTNAAGAGGIALAGLSAGADLFTGGKGKTVAEGIAKAATEDEVKKVLVKKLGENSTNNIPTEVIQQLTQENAPENIMNILQAQRGGVKEGKFVSSVKGSPEVSDATKKLVEGTYTPKANEDLAARAAARVQDGSAAQFIDDATNTAVKGIKHEQADEVVATTIELAKQLDGKGDRLGAAKLYNEIAQKLRDMGRGVQAAALLARQTPEGQIFQAERAFSNAGIEPPPEVRQKLADLADSMREAGGRRDQAEAIMRSNPDTDTLEQAAKARDTARRDILKVQHQMGEVVSQILPADRMDQLTSLWKSGLLSATTTLEGAGVGNVVKAVANTGRDVVAAGLDATITNPLLRVFGRSKGRSNSLGGILSGRLQGVGEGIKKGGEYLATGFDERNVADARDARAATFKKKNVGWLGRAYTNAVFRPLGAVDQPFFYGELRKSIREQATLAAKNAGARGADRQDFIRRFLADPPESAMARAQEEAEDATFTNPTMLGKVAAAAKRAAGDNPVGKALAELILPFAKIPSAVATAVVTYSPVGIIKEVVQQLARKELDPRALNRALADSAIGSGGAMFLGSKLYDNDMFTLATPTDAGEKELWTEQGKKPYSIRVGDKWMSLNYVQPFGSLMAMGAAYSKAKKDGADFTGAAIASAASGGQAVTQQSFLKGVAGAIAALSQPERSAQQFLENTVGSVVPNELKRVAAAGDTNEEGLVNQRDPQGLIDALQVGIPGQRDNVPQAVGGNGQPLDTGQTAAGTLFDPFKSSEAKSSPTLDELQRLQEADQTIAPTKQDANLTLGGQKIKLTPEQLNDYKQRVGTRVSELWDNIISSTGYSNLDDAGKKAALQKAKDAATTATNAEFARDNELGDTKKALSDVNGLAASVLAGTAKPDMFTTESNLLDQRTRVQMLKDTYAADKAAGKLTAVEDFKRQKAIESAEKSVGYRTQAQIAQNYSKDAVELASLGKKDLNTMIASGQVSSDLVNEMRAYEAELKASKPAKASSGRKGRVSIKSGGKVKSPKVTLAKVKAPKIAKTKAIVTKVKKVKLNKVKVRKADLA